MASQHQETRNAPARPARSRGLLFGLITLALVYGGIETLAFAGFWITDREPFSFARLQAEREALREARIDAPRQAPVADDPLLSRFVVHPYLGFVPSPKLEPKVAGDGFRRAYRGAEAVADQLARLGSGGAERGGDAVVVAIVGGSVAAGFAKSGTVALANHLKDSPLFADKEFHFAKLAWAGYKQPQQLLMMTYLLGLDTGFDMIINIDGFNEVALHPVENARKKVFAAFPRQWYYFATTLPRRLTSEYDYWRVRRAKLAAAYSQPGLRHSVLINLAWRLHDRRVQVEIQTAREALEQAESEEEAPAAMAPEHRYRDYQQLMTHLVSIWKQSSLQLDRLSRANDIAYFHFLQPNQYVAGSKPMDEVERLHALNPEHPYRRGAVVGYPMLIAEGADLARRGVNFVDLTLLFSETQERLYIDDCCHFSARGFEIAAEAIARAILRHFEQTQRQSAAPR
jgi:hypothetical protein